MTKLLEESSTDREVTVDVLFQDDLGPHAHSHEHGHSHSHGPIVLFNIKQKGCRRRLVIFAMAGAGVSFVVLASMVDAFFLQEAWEYINPVVGNATETIMNVTTNVPETAVESPNITPGAIGFFLNLVPHIPWAIAVVGVDSEHEHTLKEMIMDIIAIALPTAVMGTAVAAEFIDDISLIRTGEMVPLYVLVPVSVLIGCCIGGFELRLHQKYLHEAGGNVFIALKRSFWDNTLQQEMSVLRKAAITYSKAIVVISHGLLGYFGANKLWQKFGLDEVMPLWSRLLVNITIGLLIALFHGNTETACMDKSHNLRGYLKSTLGLLFLAGFLHTLPSSQQIAEFAHQWTEGPGDGALYNSLLLAACLVVLSPSIYAFMVTVLESGPMDGIMGYLGHGVISLINKLWCKPSMPTLDHSFTQPQSRFPFWCCNSRRKNLPLMPSTELQPLKRSDSSTSSVDHEMIASSTINADTPVTQAETWRDKCCVM